VEVHTSAGWPPVASQIAAVSTLALPFTAFATGLLGSWRAAAISARDSPSSTFGV